MGKLVYDKVPIKLLITSAISGSKKALVYNINCFDVVIPGGKTRAEMVDAEGRVIIIDNGTFSPSHLPLNE